MYFYRSETSACLSMEPRLDLEAEFEGARFLIVPGHYDYFGGAERQSLILAKHLTENFACHVDFLGWGGNGILAEKVKDLGLEAWVFPFRKRDKGFKRIVSLIRLANFIRSEVRPDYILPYVGYHSMVIGAIWKFTGARFTWWNQRDEGREVNGTWFERRLLRTLPSVVSNSYEGRDFLVRKFGLPGDRVNVINNGVQLPTSIDGSFWRNKLGMTDDDVLISMVANLTYYKDHETLIRAFVLVKQSPIGRRCKLVLAGRHDEAYEHLSNLIAQLGLSDTVEMPGAIDTVSELLSATDLFVHSSIKEGCPNAVLEAMAHRCCVIGTDISGIRQAIGSEAAKKYLSPPRDEKHLAQRIIDVAGSKNVREKAGIRNRERIEAEFSISRMTNQVLETILENRV